MTMIARSDFHRGEKAAGKMLNFIMSRDASRKLCGSWRTHSSAIDITPGRGMSDSIRD